MTNKFNVGKNFSVSLISKNEKVLSFIKTKISDANCVKR